MAARVNLMSEFPAWFAISAMVTISIIGIVGLTGIVSAIRKRRYMVAAPMTNGTFVYLTTDGTRHEVPIIPRLIPPGMKLRPLSSRLCDCNKGTPNSKAEAAMKKPETKPSVRKMNAKLSYLEKKGQYTSAEAIKTRGCWARLMSKRKPRAA